MKDQIKCNKKQYIGKVETQGANKRINKHRNDAKRTDSIGIDRHFLEPGHSFDRDFRMIVIEEIVQKNMTKEQTRLTLLRREDFWIKQLNTLEPNGYNDRLNFPEAQPSRQRQMKTVLSTLSCLCPLRCSHLN